MKVLIVDDHAIVRAGLRRLLAEEPRLELREAGNGKAAIALAREWEPDLVILDLNLPGFGGLEVIRRLKAEPASPRILVLSLHDDPLHALRALQEGAAGYVSKSAPPAEILEGIRRVGAGQRYVAAHLAQDMALLSVRASGHPLDGLTRRELEILRLLGEGSGLRQIADALGLGYKTVANSCSQIKAKLGVQRTAELIRIAVESKIASEI